MMTGLLLLITGDMVHAQVQRQRLFMCQRAWRPAGGWPAFSLTALQLGHGIAVQTGEIARCSRALAGGWGAANDGSARRDQLV